MNIKYNEYLDNLIVYKPGKPIEETERELNIKVFAKLASNENPLGTSEKVKQAISSTLNKINLYPDAGCFYLKNKISQFYNIPEDWIMVGPGSEYLLRLIALSFFQPDDEIIMSEYPFILYKINAQLMKAKAITIKPKNFIDDFAAMVDAITDKTKAIFVANPNNPLGSYISKDIIEKYIDKIPENILLVFDEAYKEYVWQDDYPNSFEYLKNKKNIIILQTFSKIYGLAGLRVGYGFAHPEIINLINKVKNVFDVSMPAQAAAIAALDDQDFVKKSKELNKTEYEYISKKLDEKGIVYVPSQTNFILIDTKKDGNEIFDYLLKKGIIVRPMKGYHLDSFIRVTIGTREQNKKFLEYLFEIL